MRMKSTFIAFYSYSRGSAPEILPGIFEQSELSEKKTVSLYLACVQSAVDIALHLFVLQVSRTHQPM